MSPLEALHKLIGRSAAMHGVREQIQRIAGSHVPVLILGETGTGKELCAGALAALSGRRPFIPVNCAAIPENLVEGQLFGYERGAYTGAIRSHSGLIATANGGILFLDELVELPLPVQMKLLRTLESGEYTPLGSTVTFRSEFRILAATSGDVDGLVAGGQLRAALLHRLGAVRICIPPLRERLEDLPLLVEAFLRRYAAKAKAGPEDIDREASALLAQSDWPGNVRQLSHVVEASAALAGGASVILAEHVLPFLSRGTQVRLPGHRPPSLADVRQFAERRAILDAIQVAGGNRELAAQALGISPATLYRKLRPGASRASTTDVATLTG